MSTIAKRFPTIIGAGLRTASKVAHRPFKDQAQVDSVSCKKRVEDIYDKQKKVQVPKGKIRGSELM